MPYANPEDAKAQDKTYYENNKEKKRAYYEKNKDKNREKRKAWDKAYYEKNKEKKRAYREKNKERIQAWREKNKEEQASKNRARKLKRNFGIEMHEYDLMSAEQKGKCACCGTHQNELTMNLAVDHDHDTGLIRGLLCLNCNTGIGKLGDNIEGLMKALNYLEKHELTKERKTNEHVVQVKPKPDVQVKVQRGHLQSQVPA